MTPLPTRSVTSAFMRALESSSAPVTQTQPPSLMPRSAASAGLISMNMSCCSSASHLLERVSSPPPSYSTRRPEVRISGNCLAIALLDRRLLHVEADVRHPELPRVRQRRILRDQLGPRRVDRLAMRRDGVRQAERIGARLAVAVGDAAVLDRDALDAARQVDRPGHRVRVGGVDSSGSPPARPRSGPCPSRASSARRG